MARDPSERYAGANGLAEDLRAYLEGHVVRAYEHGPLAELRKWVRRNPLAAVSLQLVALLLFLGVLGYALLQRGKREALAAENARTLRESYRANLHAAAASLRAGDTRDATEALDECRAAMRGFEWNHLRHRADASLRALEVAEAPILDARLAPAGALAAVSSRDGQIAILEPTGGLILRRLRGIDGDANPIAWSPDGLRLAYAGPGGELRAHTVADERDEQLLAGSGWTLCSIAWSPDGAWIACGDVHGNLRLWDARERRAAAELRAHVETISALDFDPTGLRLASGAWDGGVAVWRVPELAPEWRAPPTSVLVQDLCFSPDGSEIAAACTDKLVHLWPADSGSPQRTLAGLEHAVRSVAYDRAGLHLVTGSEDGTTAVWDRATGAIAHAMRGHDRGVTAVSTELEWPLIVTAGKDGSLRTWNAAGPGAVAHADIAAPVSALAYDAERAQLLSISSDGWLRSDDARTLASIGAADFARTNSACLSADGSTAATGAEDGEVRVLDARGAGSPLWTGRAHEGTVVCLALDPRGTRLASYGGDGAVRVRAARSGALEEEVESLPAVPKVLAFDAPGRRLAIGCVDGTVQILEEGSLRALPTSGVAIQVLALAFDPRGRLLAEGDGQGGVRIRNLATGRVQIEFDQQPRRISCLAFSSDGARLFSGAVDGSVCAWDPQCAAPLLRLSADAAVTALAVAPDASAVYAAVSDTKDRDGRCGLHAWRAWPVR